MDKQAWDEDAERQEAYQYFMRVDPDMRDFLGPIERAEDPLTGKEMRSREAKVARIRGQKELTLTRVFLDPFPHIRTKNGKDLQGWYQSKQLESRGSRVRPCMTDAVLTQPYGGYCPVGCGFCYINSGPYGYRGSGLVSVPMGYGEHVKKQLASMRTANAGYFSSFTDPFLPLEDYYHNTQSGAQAFLDEGLPIFFLSRLAYPSWAIDMLRQNPLSYAQKSINTPDPEDWKKLSPGALALGDHFAEIRELRRAGIYVSIQVNPVVAGIVTHEDIERLFELLAEAGAHHVIVKFVEANVPWAPAMVRKMQKAFGENRAQLFVELFTENSAGAQRTIDARYRLEGHERYRRKATECGMTYATCYEYVKVEGKGHASLGPVYTTADQCHGHRVPMHTRRTLTERFAALEDCPPSGCLHCADNNGGKPRCGSELLGAAKALTISDLRKDAFA